MEKIKIKVSDGEITIPTICKIVVDYQGNNVIDTMYRVLPKDDSNFNDIEFALLLGNGAGVESSNYFVKDTFNNVIEATKEEWDNTIKEIKKNWENTIRTRLLRIWRKQSSTSRMR